MMMMPVALARRQQLRLLLPKDLEVMVVPDLLPIPLRRLFLLLVRDWTNCPCSNHILTRNGTCRRNVCRQ